MRKDPRWPNYSLEPRVELWCLKNDEHRNVPEDLEEALVAASELTGVVYDVKNNAVPELAASMAAVAEVKLAPADQVRFDKGKAQFAALCAASAQPGVVRELLAFLQAPATAQLKRRHGFEPA